MVPAGTVNVAVKSPFPRWRDWDCNDGADTPTQVNVPKLKVGAPLNVTDACAMAFATVVFINNVPFPKIADESDPDVIID